jgi:hypothetical protein
MSGGKIRYWKDFDAKKLGVVYDIKAEIIEKYKKKFPVH